MKKDAKKIKEHPFVMTAAEFKKYIRKNTEKTHAKKTKTPKDKDGLLNKMIKEGSVPDLVTCATFATMSGTMAVLSFKAADPGSFKTAESAVFNGVRGFVGPCPNENNGWVDAVVYGTTASENNPRYGGGHLFKDLVAGKTIEIVLQVQTEKNKKNETIVLKKNIDDMKTAKMITTRSCFKNYTAFVNTKPYPTETIFSVLPMKGNMEEASSSGTGELNPLENDPDMKHHTPGTKVLLNGAVGYILGKGTRSDDKPNLSIAAEMRDMDPYFMGGFVTSKGVECLTCVATAVPITDFETLKNLSVLDEDIKLPVACVSDRVTFGSATYADVWRNTGRTVRKNELKCVRCRLCKAESLCPVCAIREGKITKDCVSCLTCTFACENKAYLLYSGNRKMSGGKLRVEFCKPQDKTKELKKYEEIEITLRQSDRNRAEKASLLLKTMIEEGNF